MSPAIDSAVGALELEQLRARVLALEPLVGIVEALVARVELLEAAAPRDEQDARLRDQLVVSTEGLWFASSWLWQHAAVDADLRRALVAADVTDVDELGRWLRRHRGCQDGVSIDRRRRTWRATHRTHDVIAVDLRRG